MATQQKNLVRDFFTNRVVTINDNDNVLLAAQKMKEYNVGMLPIVKAGEKNPIGVITDRDIVVRVLAAGLDPKNTKVWNVCSQDVCLVDVKDSIDSARITVARCNKKIRRVLVGDKSKNELLTSAKLGVLSIDDLPPTHAGVAYQSFGQTPQKVA